MMFRLILLLVIWTIPLFIHAQKLMIEGMQVTNDLSASQQRRSDYNGEPCGLVKVRFTTLGAKFEGNVIGNVEYKTGEYWVYMTKGSRELHIKHQSILPIEVHFSDYGINAIQPLTTYTLTLVTPQVTDVLDDGMRYLAMNVEPANATVFIDDQLQPLQNGTLTMLLPKGLHQYNVQAPSYESKRGSFTIGDEKLLLPIKLESAMATLSISSVTQGTQIFVNDQLQGTTSWSGSLPAGTYRVEGRLQGYRSNRQNVILSQRDNQQVTIPALQAITGALDVNYQPMNAEVWIDGKKMGTSPDVFRNITVGSHQLEIQMTGYETKRHSVIIEEGKTLSLSGTLTQKASSTNVGGNSNQRLSLEDNTASKIIDNKLRHIESPSGEIIVRGTVLDKKGYAIIGATVMVVGTSIGTVTDFDGNFTIKVPANGETKLKTKYVGYRTNLVTVDKVNNPKLKIVMR